MSVSKEERQAYTRIRVEVLNQVVEKMKEDTHFRKKNIYFDDVF